MKNITKEIMQNGGKAIGTFFHIGNANGVECLGLTGLDFLLIDTEHAPYDVESTMEFIRAAKLRGISPFVRIKDSTRSSVLKMFDIGAEAIIVPNVQNVEEAKKLVEYGKYFPVGNRGVAFGRGSGWGKDNFATNLTEYFEISNRESLIIPQCETMGALENIEEITAIDGVDGIFIGPFDLSVALSKPGQFDTDEFKEAIAHIVNACKKSNKFCLILALNADQAKTFFEQGFDGVVVSSDAMILHSAFSSMVNDIKGTKSTNKGLGY
ncbi:MAG: hypothetical protein FH753_12460 [Firmicutes bacterium]|nr:hypothetical protein [Bacillota bacterium]